jgi:uncharacterized protein (TIGR03032 family)
VPVHVVGAPGSDLQVVEDAFGVARIEPTAIADLGADPAARFVYVYRDPRRAVERGADPTEWRTTTDALLAALQALAPDQWCVVDADVLVLERARELQRIAEFVGMSAPAVDDLDGEVTAAASRARELFAAPQGALGGFDSQHTASFAELLDSFGASVLASTYQSGRIFAIRADDGRINTHFRTFDNPMGIATAGNRLVIGTRLAVLEYRDVPAVSSRLQPPGRHDACFLLRSSHVTGDVRIHDLEIGSGGRVWLVNTRFSCLATIDADHSFVPAWRPPFVTALAPEDRCHLNGLAMVGGEPRFVTAFGATDEPGGWRENVGTTGMIMEVPSGEVVASGLCMPHSPRWYDDRLWVLESGKGTLATVDVQSGEITTVAELPGFTRGLAFAGHYAFVGLSTVRETLFAAAPVRGRPETSCGVWVVDIRDGRTVAFVRFEGAVREIFDVIVLARRYPDILEVGDPVMPTSWVLPDAALADVPAPRRR